MDESHDRRCTCAGRASQKVCTSVVTLSGEKTILFVGVNGGKTKFAVNTC